MDPDPAHTALWMQLISILLLTGINAYFAAAEMAIVSVNKSKIHHLSQQGNIKASLIEKLLAQPTAFLSTIQVAITLAGFFNSASAATGISQGLGSLLVTWQLPYGETLALILVTLALSFITLIFGELVPKRMALQHAEAYAMFCVRPILLLSRLAKPCIALLTKTTSLVLRLFGMRDEQKESVLSKEELRTLLADSQKQGVFDAEEVEMIDGVMTFDDRLAEEIMTPRTDVFCVDVDAPLASYLDTLMELQYSRIPVYETSIDHIIGLLHIKDFMREARAKGFDAVDIKTILRKPHVALESQNIDDLFRAMQKEREHMAILVDEYGGFSGIVTMEDLIEEIMGEIEDEYDEQKSAILAHKENTYLLDGRITLEEFTRIFAIALPSETQETLSGFLLEQLGYIPEDGEQCELSWEHLHFHIRKVAHKRIVNVEVILPAPA